jgi:uncharacterized membrane-anchored protein YitT (DUF2179 family)
MPSQRLRTVLTQVIVVLIGEIINVVAFHTLIIPTKLLSGGVVGSAMLLHQLFNLPIGLQTILYNIPIFLLGYRYLGRRFVLLSVLGVASFSILLDNVTLPVLTNERLLVAVFGGVITGIADGMILRVGGSTGGFDILGLIVSKRFGISTGQVFLAFNGIIIALAAYFNNLELAMYTLIMLFVSTRTIDTMMRTRPRPVALIISSKHDEIAARLLHDLGRGVTYLQGQGAYTAVDYRVLLCVVTRFELVDLRQILHEVDPKAFTVILDASDVIGQWEQISPLSRLFG